MSDAPVLRLLGVNHTTAPVEVRERLAIAAARLGEATLALTAAPGVREALILSTCNRVELLTVEDPGSAAPGVIGFVNDYFAVEPATLVPHLYEFRDREAVRHLFRVAASLDSMVVGEPQILGQVKESYTIARAVGAIASSGSQVGLDRLLQSAFSVAKKVRSETQIGASSVSIASVAVDLARKIFGSLAGKQVLLVGAGKMSELAVRHLVEHGANDIAISNRTPGRAEGMAGRFRSAGVRTTVVPFDALYDQAPRADIVITSTGAPHQLFGRSNGEHFIQRRRGRPMFFIDIAVPRDIDPRMNEVEGCFVYDIDDLQQVASAAQTNRAREAEAAERIVADEVMRYEQRLSALDAVPAIRALQDHAEALRQAELARARKSLASLTPEQMEAVEQLTRGLAGKFLHPHLAAIRSAAEQGDQATLERFTTLYGERKR